MKSRAIFPGAMAGRCRDKVTCLLLFLLALSGGGTGMLTAEQGTASAEHFRAGAAKVDITPTDLTNLNPFGGTWSGGIHDPIFARVLVLDDGHTRAAIVATDLIEVGDTTEVRERIQEEAGIPKENITVTASHDHSAPRAGSVTPGGIAHGETNESLVYTKVLYTKIVDAIREAQSSLQPARFGLAVGDVNININRDLYTPGKGYSQGYNPDGVSEKTLWVLKFETLSGQPIAFLLNYAVHSTATLGSNMLSGDLGGEASRIMEKRLGGKAVVLYTMGPAGDQNPRYNGWQSAPQGGTDTGGPGAKGSGSQGAPLPLTASELADTFDANHSQAFMLAAEAFRAQANLQELTPVVRIHAGERIVNCPVKQGTNNSGNIVQKDVTTMPLHLGLLQLNDVALTGVSGEVVTNIYKHLLKASPLKNVIMMTIANDRAGYIADDQTYDTPTFQVKGTPFARGCAENAVVNTLTDMIKQSR